MIEEFAAFLAEYNVVGMAIGLLIAVKVGDRVKAGDFVALTGSSGNARTMPTMELGSHLHFEVRESMRPGPGLTGRLDPLKFFTPDTYNKDLYK